MKISRRDSKTKSRLIIATAILTVLLVIGIGIIIALNSLEKAKDSITDKQAQPTKTVEEKQKDTQSSGSPQVPAANRSNISIVLSAASQDSNGGPIIIRSILEGADGGSCAYSASKSGTTKTYSSNVAFSGTYYSCNYDIPYSDLSNGVWTVKVSAAQGANSGTASQEVNVK